MEAIFLICGAGGPQLKRNPLGGTPMAIRDYVLLTLMASCAPQVALAQAVHSDSQPQTRASDTIFVTAKDITPPAVQECPIRYSGLRRHGTVLVATVVDTLGRPELKFTRILKSPDDSLSTLALRATLACIFTPGRYQGKAIRVRIQLPVNF